MNTDKVFTRFAVAPTDQGELRRLARSVGNELPRKRLDVLRSARAELARAPLFDNASDSVDSESYAKGYVASVLDLMAEYETSVARQADASVLEEMVTNTGWREVLQALRGGPLRSAELAMTIGQPHDRVVQVLDELCAAGLARTPSLESVERQRGGHTRPYRLTVAGQEIADTMDSGLSDGVAQGIRAAVGLFQHLFTNPSSSADALEAIAGEFFQDPRLAAEAVNVWAEEARDAGLISERDVRDTVRESDSVPTPILAAGSEAVAAAWEQRAAPAAMTHRDLIEQQHEIVFHAWEEEARQTRAETTPLFAANDNGGPAGTLRDDS